MEPKSPVPRDLGLHSSFAGQLRLESFPGSCHTFSRPNSGLGSFHSVFSPVPSLGSDLHWLLMPALPFPTPSGFLSHRHILKKNFTPLISFYHLLCHKSKWAQVGSLESHNLYLQYLNKISRNKLACSQRKITKDLVLKLSVLLLWGVC